jgi:AMMECR1 domain-containing protein
MAIAAAQHATRFAKVTQSELESIAIEISVLPPRKKIQSLETKSEDSSKDNNNISDNV